LKKLFYYYSQIIAEIFYIPKYIGYFFSRKKRAVYIGCIGKGNLGDEAVFSAIQSLLSKKIYLYSIAFNKPSSGKYLRKLFFHQPDLILLGGGTIIKKRKDESYLRLFNKYHSKYPKAKLVVFGSGVGDPILAEQVGFPTDVGAWKNILNKCCFIGVRGPISQQILSNDWQVKTKIQTLYDPAIFFKRQKLKPKQKQKKIGINFCNILGRIYGLNQADVELFAKEIVQILIKKDWQVFLYPTANSDLDYMKSILGEDLISQVRLYTNYKNIEDSLTFMEGMDVFIGQRLHSIIFAVITYTPFHAIEYESKTSDFLLSLGLENYATRTDQLNAKPVIAIIEEQYQNIEKTQTILFKCSNDAFVEQALTSKQLFLNL